MDFAEQLRILQAAQGDTALLALATVDLAHPDLSVAERARTSEALLACAVPHWCDRDFLAALLQTTAEESDGLLDQLRSLTVVEPFPARGEHAVNVHETARLALREHLRTTDAALWQTLSARARAHVAQSHEPHARIEALYHLFATDQATAAAECEALDREFTSGGRPEVRSALALALGELTTAGWLEGAAKCEARQRDLAVAHANVGSIHRARGRLNDALADFREFLAISKRLAAADPSNAAWQRGLAIAHSKVGDIRQAQGRLDDGMVAFHECLTIFKHLTATDSSNAGWQRSTAIAHANVGSIHQKQGRFNEALTAFRECLAISKQLAVTDPSNAAWQRDLAIAVSNVGRIRQTQGRFDEALPAFREDLAISKQLAETDPSNTGWQHDLAIAHNRVGQGFQMVGIEEKAQSSFRSAVEIMEQVVATAPGNVSWEKDLAALKSWLS